ncbi:MAG: hypothetical protein Q4D98_10295 [Planctomycetia bacterium]|nr:hypothetical protein [Planctomycetia bacterium]
MMEKSFHYRMGCWICCLVLGLPEAWGIIWVGGTDSNWNTASNWETTGSLQAQNEKCYYIANGTGSDPVQHTGNLDLTDKVLAIGYYSTDPTSEIIAGKTPAYNYTQKNSSYRSESAICEVLPATGATYGEVIAPYAGTGALNLEGDLTVRRIQLGSQYYNDVVGKTGSDREGTSPGSGVLTVKGNVAVEKSVWIGQDGYASMSVVGDSFTLGKGITQESELGNLVVSTCNFGAKLSGYADLWNYTSDVSVLDLSQTKDVEIQVKDFAIAAKLGSNLLDGSAGQKYPESQGYRYTMQADVDLGVNNTITANRLVLGASYDANLSMGASTLTFGEGTNTLKIDTIVIGYWKSENAGDTADIRLGSDGGKTATITLTGKTSEMANLYVGYQNCDTNNMAHGTLDLRNAAAVNMTLDKFVIGKKTEQVAAANRTGGSQGYVYLGDNATVTANVIELGHKEESKIPESGKQTSGTLDFGGNSRIITQQLLLGNYANFNMIAQSNINMDGGFLTVTKGASFQDNISLNIRQTDANTQNGVMTIHRDESDPGSAAITQYATMDVCVSNNGKLIVDGDWNAGSIVDTTNEYAGYTNLNIQSGGAVEVNGTLSMLRQNAAYVDGGTFRVNGDAYLASQGVTIWSQYDPETKTYSGDSSTKGGYAILSVTNGKLQIGNETMMTGEDQEVNHLYAYGEMDFSIGENGVMELDGNLVLDSTQHTKVNVAVKDGVFVGGSRSEAVKSYTRYDNQTGDEVLVQSNFTVNGGTCHVAGDIVSTGFTKILIQDGELVGNNLAITGGCDFEVSGGKFIMNDMHRVAGITGSDVPEGYNTVTFKISGGEVVANRVYGDYVNTPDEAASVQFSRGTLGINMFGAELESGVNHYNLIQDAAGDASTCLLSPGLKGTADATVILGKYTMIRGTIQMDMQAGKADQLIVLSKMTIGAPTDNILTLDDTGGVAISGYYRNGDVRYEYVTLMTAEQFNDLDAVDLITGEANADGLMTYQWASEATQDTQEVVTLNQENATANISLALMNETLENTQLFGDSTTETNRLYSEIVSGEWHYKVVQSTIQNTNGDYLNELIAYRTTSTPETITPEPSAILLLLTGLIFQRICQNDGKRRKEKPLSA